MSNFWKLVRYSFIRMVWILTPLFLLVVVLQLPFLDELTKLFLALVLSAIEIYVLLKYALPWVSQVISELLLSQLDTADEEALVQGARNLVRDNRPNDALKLLEKFSHDNRRQLKAWILRADVLTHDLGRHAEAVDALKEGLHSTRWNKQDKAFFLYRIGSLYADRLKQPDKAADYWHEAATKYPRTAYGREAIKRLSH